MDVIDKQLSASGGEPLPPDQGLCPWIRYSVCVNPSIARFALFHRLIVWSEFKFDRNDRNVYRNSQTDLKSSAVIVKLLFTVRSASGTKIIENKTH